MKDKKIIDLSLGERQLTQYPEFWIGAGICTGNSLPTSDEF